MREKGDKVMNDILFIDVDSNRYDRVVIVKWREYKYIILIMDNK
jgi:hypothetical protein